MTLFVLSLVAHVSSLQAAVLITGIVDATLSGGHPKAIELYISGTEDLSNFTLDRSSNGGAFGSSIALSGLFTDEFVYLTGNSSAGETAFQTVFGTSGDYANRGLTASSIISGNGDDGFRIMDGTTVLDQVWTMDTTDSYRDSYWYRLNGTK